MIKETMIKEAINKIYVEGTIKEIIAEMKNLDNMLDRISDKLNKLLEVKQ